MLGEEYCTAVGFAVDIIEDIKAESNHDEKAFWDTTIEKS